MLRRPRNLCPTTKEESICTFDDLAIALKLIGNPD